MVQEGVGRGLAHRAQPPDGVRATVHQKEADVTMHKTILLALAAAACHAQTFDPKMPPSVPPVAGTVELRAPLRFIEIQAGTGAAAAPGQEYTVHYTGWLRDGTKFDSSVDRNEPFKFVQGRRQVIGGWEMGFEGLRVAGKRRLFLPYQLAY